MFDFKVIADNWPLLLDGAKTTALLSIVSYAIGIVIGTLACLGARHHLVTVRSLSRAYIDFFRTIPEIVPIIWLYSCTPFILDLQVEPVPVALVALSLVAGANFAEILRSGLNSISPGQNQAATALGLKRWQTGRLILLPQILPVILPPALNLFSDIVKTSSLVSLIGVAELIYRTALISTANFRYLELYTLAGIFYLCIISSVSFVASALADRRKWR